MELELFLSSEDRGRCERVLRKLARHDIRSWILTGGIAVEVHCIRRGGSPTRRPLSDIDFVAPSFDSLPPDLKERFLFRHVHPLDPPGKTILQAVDAEEAVRVDVFNDGGVASRRAENIVLCGLQIRIISFEDLLARVTRLSLDIVRGKAIAKHVRDFYRMSALATMEAMEEVWPLHRREAAPGTFKEAHDLLRDLIPRRQEYVITPAFSKDGDEVCKRCKPTSDFPLADAKEIYSILGYY
jgi:hypothetical protein